MLIERILSHRGKKGITFAVRGQEEPSEALERAHLLAARLGEPLRLLRVLNPPSIWRRLAAPLLGAIPPEPPLRDAYRATRQWLERRLGVAAAQVRVAVSIGEFSQHVTVTASLFGARVVALADFPEAPELAMKLARSSRSQVLVLRGADSRNPILAATDLQDPAFPVVRQAAVLARALSLPLVTFHNVDPLSVMSGAAAVYPGGVIGGGVSARTRRESLVGISRSLQLDLAPVLRTELDPVHAILDEAAACDASLIVVGTHRGSWLLRAMTESVAMGVASRADRAVLVAPI